MEKQKLEIVNCGTMRYQKALDMQMQFLEKRQKNLCPNTVLIVEHEPVITLGARQSENKLLACEENLQAKGIEIFSVRRGGGTTAHNPGQLVFYPIIDLRSINIGINEYIRKLEQIGIELLEKLGVSSKRRKGFPGLWVGDLKIASIGVKVSCGVTFHGMAINICNDLSIFDHIVPCGLDQVKMVSVSKLTGSNYSFEQTSNVLSEILIEHFQ